VNRPVTEILPELAGNNRSEPTERVIWEDVTIGALLSHQAGSGGVREFSANIKPCAKLMTLQHLRLLFYARIILSQDAHLRVWSVESYFMSYLTIQLDFLAYMKMNKRPVTLPYEVPVYSDGGFAMLGGVLQRLTGLPYNDAIKTILGKPLGLNSSTSIEPKDNDRNVLVVPGPAEVSSWGQDKQVIAGCVDTSTFCSQWHYLICSLELAVCTQTVLICEDLACQS
jgi:CubicO group peptidase (beta-lactamase class C family)